MHIFRITLKERNDKNGFVYADLPVDAHVSLVNFAQAIKAQGGVCNENLAIPYENILMVHRVVQGGSGIDAPVMGSA